MSGGGEAPKDNSVELANIEAQARREAQAREDAEKAEERRRFESSLGSAYNNSILDAQRYFTDRGLDAGEYTGAIQQAASRARGSVPDMAAAPGTYFDNLGATVADQLVSGKRGELQRTLSNLFPSNFATTRIADTSDDAYLDSIYQEQRGTAEEYINNLLNRGVINQTGYQGAQKNLDQQGYGAKAKLNEIGTGFLEKGRSDVNNIANSGRSAASGWELGQEFDPYSYSKQADDYFGNFFSGLGDKIRGALPGSLFSTAGLPNVAGASQGAQNLKFDPAALAGVSTFGEDEEKKNSATRSLLSAF